MSVESDIVLELIDKHGDKAGEYIYKDLELAMYVIHVGITTIQAKDRRRTRREIKSEIKPQFAKDPNSPHAVRFSKETIDKIQNHGRRLVEEWCIGGLVLGDLTKEELLFQAAREQKSSNGHMLNARIYTALANPLDLGQTMRSHWTYEMASELVRGLTEQSHTSPPS